MQVIVCDAGHAEKGSWGESRIARVSYADDMLVKLARRSYELYDELDKTTTEPVMYKTGCLDVGFKRRSGSARITSSQTLVWLNLESVPRGCQVCLLPNSPIFPLGRPWCEPNFF